MSDDGFSELLSMAGDADQPGDAVCWVCSEGATEQEPLVRQGAPGVIFHTRCLGAKRALDTSKGLSDQEKKKLDDLRKNDQPAYKAMIMKTRAPVGARRGGDERAKLKKVMQEFLSYSTVERVKPRLLLNEVRFIQWHKVNEGLDDAAATQKWIDSRSNPSVYREWEDGELVLAVKGNTEINGIEGASNVNKSGNEIDVDNDQQMAAMLNQRAAFTHDAFSGVGGKALSAHAAVVPSSGPGSASSGSDNTSMGRAGAQDLLAGLFASASAPVGIAPTNSPQEPHTPKATGNAAGIINVGSSSESLETSPLKVADENNTQVTKMTDSQFYKAKRALVSELEALMTTHHHKKSLQAQLKDLVANFKGPEYGETQILKDLGTEDVWTMKLNPNQLVWVPPGFYPLLVTEDVGAKLLIWPWLVPAVYKDTPLDEFLFVYAGAEEFVQKQEKAPWIQIKEPLLQFREQICSTDQLAQFLSATATRAKASTEKEAASGPASVVEVIGAKKTSAASAKPAVETDGPKEDKSS